MDQRDFERFDVKARCQVWDGASHTLDGVTDNISRSGVLVHIKSRDGRARLPDLGDQMTIDIELNENRRFGQKYLRCTGTVVRVLNARRSEPRVALSISQMEFKDRSGGKKDLSVKRKDFALLFGGKRRVAANV